MLDLSIIKEGGVNLVDSRLLHKELKVNMRHRDWIKRRITKYNFEKGKDYYFSQRSNSSGGMQSKEYLLTIDMAKELCMLENTDVGSQARKYFIAIEKEFRKTEVIRLAGIQTRKNLTDILEESGENERMHGHGFSNYTMMIYDIVGLKNKYKEYKYSENKLPFRDILSSEELKRINTAESLVKPLLDIDKKYGEIKEVIEPLFTVRIEE